MARLGGVFSDVIHQTYAGLPDVVSTISGSPEVILSPSTQRTGSLIWGLQSCRREFNAPLTPFFGRRRFLKRLLGPPSATGAGDVGRFLIAR